jgi:hypothetical protein
MICFQLCFCVANKFFYLFGYVSGCDHVLGQVSTVGGFDSQSAQRHYVQRP